VPGATSRTGTLSWTPGSTLVRLHPLRAAQLSEGGYSPAAPVETLEPWQVRHPMNRRWKRSIIAGRRRWAQRRTSNRGDDAAAQGRRGAIRHRQHRRRWCRDALSRRSPASAGTVRPQSSDR
jgi:hypothetical protein